MKKINEICDILNGYAFKSKYYVDSGIRVIRIANVQDGYISDENPCFYPNSSIDDIEKYILKENDLLISLTGNVGRVALLNKEYLPAALNQRVACLRIKESYVDKKYLFYYLNQRKFIDDCIKASKGVAQLNLSTKWLESYQLDIPPIKEQERIVAKIEELFSDLDNAVDTLNITEKKLHLYRQSVIKEAFTGSFTESYRKANDTALDMELPWLSEEQTMELPKIPESWKYILLSNLGDLGRGKSKHRPRNDARLFVDGKYPFIQTSEVKSADKYITEYSKMYNDFGLSQSKLWPSGTLCITIAANIAETAFLGLNACFPDSVVGFTPSDNILSEYIRYFIESQKAELSAFAPATAQKNINLTTLENLVIPYCSLKEQKRIVDEIESRLTAYLNIEKTVNDALQQASAMRQSILKQAFEGRLL